MARTLRVLCEKVARVEHRIKTARTIPDLAIVIVVVTAREEQRTLDRIDLHVDTDLCPVTFDEFADVDEIRIQRRDDVDGDKDLLTIGAKTEAQLNDNLAATSVELSSDDLKKLDDVSKLKPEYPGWMLERQGGERTAGLS